VAVSSSGDGVTPEISPDASEVSGTRHIAVIVDTVTPTYYFIDQESKDVRKIELGPLVQQQLASKPQSGTSRTERPLPTSPRRSASKRFQPRGLLKVFPAGAPWFMNQAARGSRAGPPSGSAMLFRCWR
jgi:hypothetical protein